MTNGWRVRGAASSGYPDGAGAVAVRRWSGYRGMGGSGRRGSSRLFIGFALTPAVAIKLFCIAFVCGVSVT